MQQQATTSTSSAPPSFAGLLASLTAPTPRTAWNNDDLADDVATLSYEHALRAHARYKSVEPGDGSFPQADGSGVVKAKGLDDGSKTEAARTSALWDAPGWNEEIAPKAALGSFTVEENKKCASITIRLSKTECDQLRKRAAQAGLTVSAYLRSCTFEAEALRAQVKDVLAELRQATSAEEGQRPVVVRRSFVEWLLRLMPRFRRQQGVVRA